MKRMIEKTNGAGETIMVEDPDYYNEEGCFVKKRRKPTNISPKKKKRK